MQFSRFKFKLQISFESFQANIQILSNKLQRFELNSFSKYSKYLNRFFESNSNIES